MNVVLVAHPNASGKFMFKVPEDVKLRAGDLVLCNTKRDGKAIGLCLTDSFIPDDPEKIASLWGSNVKGMRPVIGKLNPEMYAYDPPEETDPAESFF